MNSYQLKVRTALSLIFFMVFMIIALQAPAQKKKKKAAEVAEQETVKKVDKSTPKTISELVKAHDVFEGLFTFYQDSASGALKMKILKENIGQEFIHFFYVENGAVEAGAFRGNYRGSQIFKIERYFDKIDFVLQNTSSYFDPENALSRSEDANYSHGIIHSAKIVASDKDGVAYLIEADDLFLKEAFGFVKMPPPLKANPGAFSLGNLSSDKTKYLNIRNYPENSDVVVEYVYENGAPKNQGSRAITDARNVSIVVQHTLMKVPENDYVTRFDDPRVGYFTSQVTDMTSVSATPYRDLIHRWNLIKKDRNAKLSEPVEPIVFWMENTTPDPLRPVIKEAGERWNRAFEAAGFKNAIQVKVQPDTASWDAGDIRYNVLRWTSSPSPLFGGYGPSFVNPRTGQILGADIMLEWVYLTNRVRYDKMFSTAALMDYDPADASEKENYHYCDFGLHHHYNTLFGKLALKAMDVSDAMQSQLIRESIEELVLHEMGHTLGLSHNMKASQMNSVEELKDADLNSQKGLIGSVMDYAPTHIALDPEDQGQFYMTTPGPYDIWAIAYGYQDVASQEVLDSILARSNEPDLAFGNDADDMRSSNHGIDPRVMVNDLSSDAIGYAVQEFELTKRVAAGLLERFQGDTGTSYHEMRNAYLVLTAKRATAAGVVSRYIGGVYVNRSMIGQEGAKAPFIPVETEKQIRAMKVLAEYVFAPQAFEVDSELFSYLQMQRRGFDFLSKTEDPKLHQRILNIQKSAVNHLLHVNTLQRLSDSQLYGNNYTMDKMMTDLNDAIFKIDAGQNVNTFRQNLQTEYVKKLVQIVDPATAGYTNMARSMALFNLKSIEKLMSAKAGDVATLAHRQYISLLIEKALKV